MNAAPAVAAAGTSIVRIRDLVKKGQTLDQVKAAKPTRDYDARFGATSGAWTTDMFVEAAYKSLAATKAE